MPPTAVYSACHDESDEWASAFFRSMLARELSTVDFEAAVQGRWHGGDFILRAPRTASWLRLKADQLAVDACYARETPHLGFRSRWLVGIAGQPGAIHIEAPAERASRGALRQLNRPPHQHDSGRIALVTGGRAIFHVLRDDGDGQPALFDCPVGTGDMIFWPAWTPHTFNARQGFSLVSAMASYVAPSEDGFVFPVEGDLERLPRKSYQNVPV